MFQTALHLAASGDFSECVQTLLDNGADIHVKNSRQETALDVVKGKNNSSKSVLQQEMTKFKIPRRSSKQQSKCTGEETYT